MATSLSYGQNSIKGRVVEAINSDAPISNVRVTISNNISGAIVAYAFSNAQGTFEIKVTGQELPLKLEAGAMGFKTVSMILNEWPSGIVLINLKEGALELNEAKVVAPIVSLKGDTLNFMTSGFSKVGDRSIEEVIKRIPGIEVASSGEIRYNDTPINALYIDGKNILGEKYSIATKNLKPNLIAMIQVFENHQPVKALKDFTPSQSAAVNLRLTTQAKAEWITSASLAAGFDAPLFESTPLYDIKLLLFRFAPKVQTMNIIRSNNRGMSVQEDIKTHNVGTTAQARLLFTEELNLVNVTGDAVPPIGEERVLFNNGGYVSSNSLFSVGKEREVSVKASYYLESKERAQQEYTTYFLADEQQLTIGEKSEFRGVTHCPEADFNFKSNGTEHFLQARVNFRGRVQENSSNIYTSQDLNSKASLNQYDINAITTYIKPFGNSLLKLSSNTYLSSLPQSLTISKQENLVIVDSAALFQEISLKRVLSNNSAEFVKRWGYFSAVALAGIDLRYEQLSSEYSNDYTSNDYPNNNFNGSSIDQSNGYSNNESGKYYRDQSNANLQNQEMSSLFLSVLHFSPSLRFDNKRLFVSASLPLKLFNTRFKTTPELSARYKISSYWDLMTSFVSSVNFTDITQTYPWPLMVNYRFYKSGTDKMAQNKMNAFVLKAVYSNPLKLLNLWASFSRTITSSETTNHYNYFDNSGSFYPDAYMQLSQLFDPSKNSSSSLILNFTKSFFDTPLLISIKLTGIDSKSQMVQQEVAKENRLKFYSATAAFDLSIGNSTDISIILPYSETIRESVWGVKPSLALSSFNPSLNAVIKFTKKTRVAINTTLNLNELSQGLFYLYPFTNVDIRMQLKRIELFAQATNIFDNRQYKYKTIGDFYITEMLYKLRPFSFIAGLSFSF